MAEAGTSPPACYQTSLPVHRVMLRLRSNHDESDAPPQPVESNSVDSDESEYEVDDIEFDSDESDGNDCVEDGARLHNRTTMNRSYPLKLFFKLDADQGFEGQSVLMDDLYNTCQ